MFALRVDEATPLSSTRRDATLETNLHASLSIIDPDGRGVMGHSRGKRNNLERGKGGDPPSLSFLFTSDCKVVDVICSSVDESVGPFNLLNP